MELQELESGAAKSGAVGARNGPGDVSVAGSEDATECHDDRTQDPGGDTRLKVLAEALASLSETDRARLAAMLRG